MSQKFKSEQCVRDVRGGGSARIEGWRSAGIDDFLTADVLTCASAGTLILCMLSYSGTPKWNRAIINVCAFFCYVKSKCLPWHMCEEKGLYNTGRITREMCVYVCVRESDRVKERGRDEQDD